MANSLSRLHQSELTSTIFPEVLKATCQAITLEQEHQPFAGSLVESPEMIMAIEDERTEIPLEVLKGTALTKQDWRKAQASDSSLNLIIDYFIMKTCLFK